MFECQNVNFYYQLGTERIQALHNVSLTIPEGDFLCLQGPSGSGKSTLLNLLGLVENLQEGRILFDGQDLASLPEIKKNAIRKLDLGFIFQTFNLIPSLTAFENAEYFLIKQKIAFKERQERVKNALSSVGLWEHKDKYPLQMSGGQRQRVAIARAFAKRPRVVIADEPTASLDQHTGLEIIELLKKLNEETKVSVIIASHDPMVIEHSRRKIILKDGRICC